MKISVALLKELEGLDPNVRRAFITFAEEINKSRKELVIRKDFSDLKKVVGNLVRAVQELTEAQKKSEERLSKLEVAISELAEAQKRTEERIAELAEAQRRTEERVSKLEVAVSELAEAQKRAEERVSKLEVTVSELAEAQRRTEEKMAELAEAQRRTEERVSKLEVAISELAEAQRRTEEKMAELAEAQRRTEISIKELFEAQRRNEEMFAKLIQRMDHFEERLEGISNSVGYGLEDRSYRTLPKLLEERLGIRVKGNLFRRYVYVGGRQVQFNIFGYGIKGDEEILILGECKVRPSRREIERFERFARELSQKEGKEAFLLFVAYDFQPEIEDILRGKGMAYFWSYELELS